MTALLEARGLARAYPGRRDRRGRRGPAVRAVAGVDLSVGPGETLALVGESGSGKSTLARLVMRLEAADAGTVHLAGADLHAARGAALRRLRRTAQIVFQDPDLSLSPRMRCEAIVAEPLVAQGLPEHGGRAARRARVAELLAAVGLPAGAAGRFPHELSGGERQRVAIARALALGPRLLVLDEPVSALDAVTRARVLGLLERLRAESGLAYLLIAHDLGAVRRLAHRVSVMYLGRIVEEAPAADLYARPAHPYTAALLDAAPLAEPLAERRRRRTSPALAAPDPARPPSGCPYHPRCPRAEPVCAERRPELVPHGDGRVACHFPAPAGA